VFEESKRPVGRNAKRARQKKKRNNEGKEAEGGVIIKTKRRSQGSSVKGEAAAGQKVNKHFEMVKVAPE